LTEGRVHLKLPRLRFVSIESTRADILRRRLLVLLAALVGALLEGNSNLGDAVRLSHDAR
jgi:hypothetical protein